MCAVRARVDSLCGRSWATCEAEGKRLRPCPRGVESGGRARAKQPTLIKTECRGLTEFQAVSLGSPKERIVYLGRNLRGLGVYSRQMQVSEEEGSEKGSQGTLNYPSRGNTEVRRGGGCLGDSERTRGPPPGGDRDLWGEAWPMSPLKQKEDTANPRTPSHVPPARPWFMLWVRSFGRSVGPPS